MTIASIAGPVSASHSRRASFVTVVLPCLNEEQAVGPTVEEALRGLERSGYPGEVLVVDNGSTDASVERAAAAGARVVHEERRGYGAAHLGGIREARGDVIIMADADCTYDLENLGQLVQRLEGGADMVVANRFGYGLDRKAMPLLHRYVGTPLITRFVKTVTRVPVDDSQSGYRAFWAEGIRALRLRTPGMEYASEMLLRAGSAGWRVEEVPSTYRERVGESKLSTFSDGWRHLRLLLIMSPHLSLLLPGFLLALAGAGLAALTIAAPGGVDVGGWHWGPVFLGPMLLIVGAQVLFLGLMAAHRSDLTPPRIRALTHVLDGKGAVDRLLWRFTLVFLLGALIDAVLLGLYLADFRAAEFLGIAGVAQALIVIGIGGVATVLGAEFAHRSMEL